MNEWVRPGDLSKFIVPRIDLCHVQYAILPWLLMWLHSGLPHVRIGLLHSIKMAWLYRSHHFLLLSIVSVGAILLWTLLRLRQLRDGKLEVRLCTSEILERQHCCMVRIVASGAGWPVFKDAISFVVPGMSYQERLETIHASVNCRYNSVAISFFFFRIESVCTHVRFEACVSVLCVSWMRIYFSVFVTCIFQGKRIVDLAIASVYRVNGLVDRPVYMTNVGENRNVYWNTSIYRRLSRRLRFSLRWSFSVFHSAQILTKDWISRNGNKTGEK